MNTLIEILKKETETLRVQYLEMTKEWAAKQYNDCKEKMGWGQEQWCNFFGITPEVKNQGGPLEFKGFPRGFHNTRDAKTYSKAKEMINAIAGQLKIEEYIEKAVKVAELHYEGSIEKLAQRIEQKGLDQNNLKATTSHIGANINTTLTDGVKQVRAFTIIASGEIQKPHYRYLIK